MATASGRAGFISTTLGRAQQLLRWQRLWSCSQRPDERSLPGTNHFQRGLERIHAECLKKNL